MAKHLLMGNEAFAHAALAAGVRVVAGYPGTPSSEVIETIAAERAAGRAAGVHVEWSTNEKVAFELLAGASLAGARCLFACKQVGLNVASDALMSLNYVGIKGGLVLFVADDPGPISSQTEQDTRRFAAFAKVPVLDPATVEQGCDMIQAAFDLSEAYATPVIVRSSTRICHASTFMDFPEYTQVLEASGFERSPRWVIFPRRAFEAHGEIIERLFAIAHDYFETKLSHFNPVEISLSGFDSSQEACENRAPKARTAKEGSVRSEGKNDDAAFTQAMSTSCRKSEAGEQAAVGIVAGGVSASYVLEALSILKARCLSAQLEFPPYRFIQVGTPYPFPEKTLVNFAQGLEAILVLEELDHVLEDEMLKLCGISHGSYEVYGKLSGHTKDRGENTVDDIAGRIASFFGIAEALEEAEVCDAKEIPGNVSRETLVRISTSKFTQGRESFEPPPALANLVPPELPQRPPVLCAGCPHRGSFYAIKRALKQTKQEAIFCGDIGCYTLGNALPLDAVDTCLCMGAGITMAQGFSVVNRGRHQIAQEDNRSNALRSEISTKVIEQAANPKAVRKKPQKQIAFVGDSTFFAAGLPGIVNAVYNEHPIMVVVLDNSITAMTGAQPHPGTGETLMGRRHPGISIEAVLRAVGFEHMSHANPFNLEESVLAAKEALRAEDPSALIYKAPCISLVKPKAPVRIDQSCVGCKKCISEIGCPAICFDHDEQKAFINETLCTGCGLCVPLCPFKSIRTKDIAQPNASGETFQETEARSAGEGKADTQQAVPCALDGEAKTGETHA